MYCSDCIADWLITYFVKMYEIGSMSQMGCCESASILFKELNTHYLLTTLTFHFQTKISKHFAYYYAQISYLLIHLKLITSYYSVKLKDQLTTITR